jgi:hypothetical protein
MSVKALTGLNFVGFIIRCRSISDRTSGIFVGIFCWYPPRSEMDTNKEDTNMPRSNSSLNDTFLKNLKNQEQKKNNLARDLILKKLEIF